MVLSIPETFKALNLHESFRSDIAFVAVMCFDELGYPTRSWRLFRALEKDWEAN